MFGFLLIGLVVFGVVLIGLVVFGTVQVVLVLMQLGMRICYARFITH